ncbi:hypothetical protein NLU13_8713 [Sarocladium strictum]|uniref:Uncharacterized protein n=1 Tax=Sarocladium strictum TaxID=5046 RepID=A0AA39GEK5_SARSR|nr:hypothetical protein NLU13_8713 [Sarocladium strictum]
MSTNISFGQTHQDNTPQPRTGNLQDRDTPMANTAQERSTTAYPPHVSKNHSQSTARCRTYKPLCIRSLLRKIMPEKLFRRRNKNRHPRNATQHYSASLPDRAHRTKLWVMSLPGEDDHEPARETLRGNPIVPVVPKSQQVGEPASHETDFKSWFHGRQKEQFLERVTAHAALQCQGDDATPSWQPEEPSLEPSSLSFSKVSMIDWDSFDVGESVSDPQEDPNQEHLVTSTLQSTQTDSEVSVDATSSIETQTDSPAPSSSQLAASDERKPVLPPPSEGTPEPSPQKRRRHGLLAPSYDSGAASSAADEAASDLQATGESSRTPGVRSHVLFPPGADWDNMEYYLPPLEPREDSPAVRLTTEEGEVIEDEDRMQNIGEVKISTRRHGNGKVRKKGKSVRWGGVTVVGA